jgi:hypothetical protein
MPSTLACPGKQPPASHIHPLVETNPGPALGDDQAPLGDLSPVTAGDPAGRTARAVALATNGYPGGPKRLHGPPFTT